MVAICNCTKKSQGNAPYVWRYKRRLCSASRDLESPNKDRRVLANVRVVSHERMMDVLLLSHLPSMVPAAGGNGREQDFASWCFSQKTFLQKFLLGTTAWCPAGRGGIVHGLLSTLLRAEIPEGFLRNLSSSCWLYKGIFVQSHELIW